MQSQQQRQDQEMREETGRREEGGREMGREAGRETSRREEQKSGGGSEGGFMHDYFKEFDEMSKGLFGDFSKIDQEIERRFKDFSDTMEKNRQRQLQEFRQLMDTRRHALGSA